MALKRTPRPRDPVQLGKLMVDIMTGAVPDAVEESQSVKQKRTAGIKGGAARAKVLSPQERSEIASVAASARWKKS